MHWSRNDIVRATIILTLLIIAGSVVIAGISLLLIGSIA